MSNVNYIHNDHLGYLKASSQWGTRGLDSASDMQFFKQCRMVKFQNANLSW